MCRSTWSLSSQIKLQDLTCRIFTTLRTFFIECTSCTCMQCCFQMNQYISKLIRDILFNNKVCSCYMTWSREMSRMSKILNFQFLTSPSADNLKMHRLVANPYNNWYIWLQSYEQFINWKQYQQGNWTLSLPISQKQYLWHPIHSTRSCHWKRKIKLSRVNPKLNWAWLVDLGTI